MTLFILPEVLARMIMPPKKVILVHNCQVIVVEFMAWISTCLCYCRGGEYFNDDDCKLDWILRGIGWHHGLVKGDFGELLR